MRHARTGKKLGRDSSHRKALYANLTCSLIEHGRIKTTEAKAKAVKPYAEKLITLGKRGDLHARRQGRGDNPELQRPGRKVLEDEQPPFVRPRGRGSGARDLCRPGGFGAAAAAV